VKDTDPDSRSRSVEDLAPQFKPGNTKGSRKRPAPIDGRARLCRSQQSDGEVGKASDEEVEKRSKKIHRSEPGTSKPTKVSGYIQLY
jgi:hypothetical protein